MNMRIGGLASGIDTDTIIKDLMKAERIPLDKMEQKLTTLEWQRDKYREINTKIDELEKSLTQVKMSSTYNTKSVNSTMESAVTAAASAGAYDGNYSINVSQLATNEIYEMVMNKEDFEVQESGIYSYYTINENGTAQEHKVELKVGDTLETVLRKISDASDNRVHAYYVEETKQVVFETTRTGDYNPNDGSGSDFEIIFGHSSLSEIQQKDIVPKLREGEVRDDFKEITALFDGDIQTSRIEPAKNAEFTYNGFLELTSKSNSYTLNGINFQFNDVTDKPAKLTVSSDVDATIEKITDFLDKYNELIDLLNGTQQEQKYRDYPPLTEEQKKEMEEKEIELWEEKAKSGLLRNDGIISSSLFELRQNWYEKVESGDAYSVLSEIGITTTKDWLDGGKLEISDRKALEDALTKDPEAVQRLFVSGNDIQNDKEKGLINRLEDSLIGIMERIEERAGKGSAALQTYTLGKQMDSIQGSIDAFEDRLVQIEDRYWRQFTAMERAISMMNQQSAMLMSFGGQQ